MDLRKLFRRSQRRRPAEEHYSLDDLLALGRLEEAEQRLTNRLKQKPSDLHARLKLAEVHLRRRRREEAVAEYLNVAQRLGEDGFLDRALAVLSSARRQLPEDPRLDRQMARLQEAKKMDVSRVYALEGLRLKEGTASYEVTSLAVELQGVWPNLATSRFVRELPPEQIRRLFSVMTLVSLKVGEKLAEQGANLSESFVIAEGTLDAVVATGEANQAVLRSFTAGDLIGERALLEQQPWLATYRASEPARLLRLTRSGLQEALVGNSDPKGLLDALRSHGRDREVAAAVDRMGMTS